MQILVYAGAILVIFMFVIVLFQDAYMQILKFKPQSSRFLLFLGLSSLVLSFGYFGKKLLGQNWPDSPIASRLRYDRIAGRDALHRFLFSF